MFDVPYATLHSRLHGKGTQNGAPTRLCPLQQGLLMQLLIYMADIGCGLQKLQLLDLVASYLQETNQAHLFPGGVPGDDWYKGFLKRHSELSVRIARNLGAARANATDAELVDKWFARLMIGKAVNLVTGGFAGFA